MRCDPTRRPEPWRVSRFVALVLLASAAILLAGCGHDVELIIPAEPAERSSADLGLGPGVRPLTFGPGDKDSPRWGPSGKRLAYILDGYVVDKQRDTSEIHRLTTRDLGAYEVEWVSSGDGLAILGPDLSKTSTSPASQEPPRAIYRTGPGSTSLSVDKVAANVLAMGPLPNGNLLVALGIAPDASTLAVIDGEKVSRTFPYSAKGSISGLCVSPDGSKAVMAIRRAPSGSFEVHAFDLSDGTSRRIGDLPRGQEIFGAPQWTKHGIYYVVGRARTDGGGDAAPYDLFHLPLKSGEPEPVAGVGEEFVASSLMASPDGGRLAVLGRRNPNAPEDLYVLDLATGVLEAITENENMDIKTEPEDLAWSPDGDHVAIVARGILTGHRVYDVRAEALLADFYNIYDVPVGSPGSTGNGLVR